MYQNIDSLFSFEIINIRSASFIEMGKLRSLIKLLVNLKHQLSNNLLLELTIMFVFDINWNLLSEKKMITSLAKF
jgi:hypothetical protein